jgi:hypothetical protein
MVAVYIACVKSNDSGDLAGLQIFWRTSRRNDFEVTLLGCLESPWSRQGHYQAYKLRSIELREAAASPGPNIRKYLLVDTRSTVGRYSLLTSLE